LFNKDLEVRSKPFVLLLQAALAFRAVFNQCRRNADFIGTSGARLRPKGSLRDLSTRLLTLTERPEYFEERAWIFRKRGIEGDIRNACLTSGGGGYPLVATAEDISLCEWTFRKDLADGATRLATRVAYFSRNEMRIASLREICESRDKHCMKDKCEDGKGRADHIVEVAVMSESEVFLY
jgi:hypothetical protein